MTEYHLVEGILQCSRSKIWDIAKSEWKLDGIDKLDRDTEPLTCLCGHYPIRELCYIHNEFTGQRLIVGNCCILRFTGLDSKRIFSSLKRVKRDNRRAFNADFINMAYDHDLLSEWESKFYLDTWRKRYLTSNQMRKRVEINEKLLRYYDGGFGVVADA